MAKSFASLALLLTLNLVFFTLVTSTYVPCPPKGGGGPSGGHGHHHHGHSKAKCPRDTLKLRACGDLLNDLVHLVVGTPLQNQCCPLIEGLVDLDAAVCLCTAVKADVLSVINLEVSLALTLILNYCGKNMPEGFNCQ
ncbi:unnamed protein product [Cuscuta campestris]|uniref:Bifunctional inhibitor/plant lipid transfer protein/seed storage helical domain-containing protein n=2 Tax=Cuscuta sect. Cleistogrammica TaxID=1824901 RepID=A0A484L345_9ASTE|nr:hypothetical protein DM860_001816 [Cuscuta australis]VFQ70749.1 unnamed protein product [Cuscuta campestris]